MTAGQSYTLVVEGEFTPGPWLEALLDGAPYCLSCPYGCGCDCGGDDNTCTCEGSE